MVANGAGRVVVGGGPDDAVTDAVERLTSGGYGVVRLGSTAACLDRLDEDDVAAVVCAFDDTAGACLGLLESIRDRHPRVPVLLYPQAGSERLAGRALAAGASGYVPRDAGVETLFERVKECVSGADIRGEERGRYRNLIDASPAPINLFDAEGRTVWGNDAVVDLLGLESRSALVGRSIFEFIHPDDHDLAEGELGEIVDGDTAVGPTYMRLVQADGEIRHIRVSTAPGRYAGEPVGQAVVIDVTALRRNERRLERLNELLGECVDAETKRAVCTALVAAAEGDLALPVVSLALLDDAKGHLEVVAETSATDRALADATLWEHGNEAWRAFTAGESTVLATDASAVPPAVEGLYLVPLGRHGVLVAGIEAGDEEFVQLIAENVQGMFDRIERAAALKAREADLRNRNEMLARVTRINEVIRSIDAELVGATTRAAVDTAVCQELVETDLFEYAWIGDYDRSTDRVVPREHCGAGAGFLDALDTGSGGEPGPAVRAARHRATQVVDDILTEPPLARWREAAVERGFRSSISLPLRYHGGLYGVLTIYAGDTDVFDETERTVLEELSDVIAHAMNAIESRRALVSDAVIELELGLTLDAGDFEIVDFVTAANERTFDLHAVVPSETGGLRIIAAFAGATPSEVTALATRSPTMERVDVLAEDDDRCTVELVVTPSSPLFWLVDHGAVPRSFTVDETGARLVVDLAVGTDVRAFIEELETVVPNVELRSRTDRERPVRTRSGLLDELDRELTPRQHEVLRTAYASGYFETPRTRSGAEVADSLGISQPTFSSHLRTGLRETLRRLFDDADRDQA